MSSGRITIKDLAAEIVYLHTQVTELKRNQNLIVDALRDHESSLNHLHARLGAGVLEFILESDNAPHA